MTPAIKLIKSGCDGGAERLNEPRALHGAGEAACLTVMVKLHDPPAAGKIGEYYSRILAITANRNRLK